MRRIALATLVLFALILALPLSAHAAPVFVSQFGSDETGSGSALSPYASVQKAIDMGRDGDDVYVGPGTFVGNVSMKDGVSIHGAGATKTTLRGAGRGAVVAAVVIGSGETIEGFTITGGDCGGIYCDGSSPTIAYNTVSGNTGGYGGGIFAVGDFQTIAHNTISGNSADGYGGGIMCAGRSVRIEANTISGNTARAGAGISDLGRSTTIRDNTIADNVAGLSSWGGGGVWANGEDCAITHNTIVRNRADGWGGGGISLTWGSVLIADNTISENVASLGHAGGGIAIDGWGLVTITGNHITRNSAFEGAGIWDYGLATISNNVIASNEALVRGGGIYSQATTATIANNTVVSNTAIYGEGGGISSYPGSPAVVYNCVLWGNDDDLDDCSAIYSNVEDGDVGLGNISAPPSFVQTLTGDFRLQPDSPCIDGATSTAAPRDDRLGVRRPQGAGVDMGAFEYFDPRGRVAPDNPTLSSSTHSSGVWSTHGTVRIAAAGAEGSVASIAGYAMSVSTGATEYPTPLITHSADTTGFVFEAKAGVPLYVNVATVDTAGNWSAGTHFGPILVDQESPVVADDATDAWVGADTSVTLSGRDAGSGVGGLEWVLRRSSGESSGGASPAPAHALAVTREGTTSIDYSAVDVAGNRCTTRTATVRVDKTAPRGTIGVVPSPEYLAKFSIRGADALSGVSHVSWRVDQEPTQTMPGAWATVECAVPGAHTIAAWVTDEAGNRSAPQVTTFTVTGPSEIRMSSGSATLARYRDTFTLSGTLMSGGAPASGVPMMLQTSVDGVTFSDCSVVTTTAAGGYFELRVVPTAKTVYRARAVASPGVAGVVGPAVYALPRALVGTPVAPASMRLGRGYTVSGTLRPRHTSRTQAVRIYLWHYESGRWKAYGYRNASVSDYLSYSKFSTSLVLKSSGRWRIRAYHCDAGHAPSWSGGYDYISVYR